MIIFSYSEQCMVLILAFIVLLQYFYYFNFGVFRPGGAECVAGL